MTQIISKVVERCLQRNRHTMAMLACEIHGIEYRLTGRTQKVKKQNPHTPWDGITYETVDGWQLVFRKGCGEFLTYATPGSGFVNRMAKHYCDYIQDFD